MGRLKDKYCAHTGVSGPQFKDLPSEHGRNSNWTFAQWSHILPQVLPKFIALPPLRSMF